MKEKNKEMDDAIRKELKYLNLSTLTALMICLDFIDDVLNDFGINKFIDKDNYQYKLCLLSSLIYVFNKISRGLPICFENHINEEIKHILMARDKLKTLLINYNASKET